MTHRYIGSGPYCSANCLAMVSGGGTDPGCWRCSPDRQYPLAARDDAAIAILLRDLVPTYRQLSQALSAS